MRAHLTPAALALALAFVTPTLHAAGSSALASTAAAGSSAPQPSAAAPEPTSSPEMSEADFLPWRRARPVAATVADNAALSTMTPASASADAQPGMAAGPANPVPARPEYDLPMPWGEPSFEAWRASYLTPDGRRWLAAVLERARPWLPYVMQRIYYYGLPEELAFLPVIESEYASRAVSKSGATGMWQFMKNSIGGYGIRIDDWVDERRDFMKSTDAALRKLADNRARLGDWNLALAAYNMGLGAITRAVAASGKSAADPDQAGGRLFFTLREGGFLSKETSAYVPKFLAVASILRYPRGHGLVADWRTPLEWEDIELDRSVDLSLLAEAAGLPFDELRAANAELRFAVTPPWKGYRVKVPAGNAPAVTAALADPERKLLRYTLHVVRSGDSVSALSRAYGAPIELIVEANPGLDPSRIRIGQTLVVPVLKEGAIPPTPPEIVDDGTPFDGKLVVAKGDSLWGIALRYGVRPEILADRNGLELTSVLREGMSLAVPITKP